MEFSENFKFDLFEFFSQFKWKVTLYNINKSFNLMTIFTTLYKDVSKPFGVIYTVEHKSRANCS